MGRGVLRTTAVPPGLKHGKRAPDSSRKWRAMRGRPLRKRWNNIRLLICSSTIGRKNLLRGFDRADGPLGKIFKIDTEKTGFLKLLIP